MQDKMEDENEEIVPEIENSVKSIQDQFYNDF